MIKTHSKKIEWCLEQHSSTNHFYDEYLPYEFHLRMVVQSAKDFEKLIPASKRYTVIMAAWGHDLIEDSRVSYIDVSKNLEEEVADIIYAVTNEKGKNRKERANEKYYEGIRKTSGAVFVKLCDRIANVQYSKMTKSRMFEVYKEENLKFEKMLGRYTENKHLEEMFRYLNDLFENEGS